MSPDLAAMLRLDPDALPPVEGRSAFYDDVMRGLTLRQKTLPAKYFYDTEGSRLFDRICELPEYYPTRTEIGILRDHADDIAAFAGEKAALIEFGSGSSTKVRLLLGAMRHPAYVPIDISGEHMIEAVERLRLDYPDVPMHPVETDFTQDAALPTIISGRRRIGFFPGSTIGNFTPDQAEAFLRRAAGTLGAGAGFVVGVDLKKDPAVLHAAYNDRQGVTAAFNLNLLARINRELHGEIDLAHFRHLAFYNAAAGRVEMHIESLKRQRVRIAGDMFAFRNGETIHTENSCKYAVDEFQALAKRAGWHPEVCFTDADKLFSVHLLAR
ncbi:L-histidine N(alpha)-methyltransferase [Flaviflagellibacter deserti]|jgi:L-histidine Nalpha-methyltransferase|uniref:L-histidine N(Alpha)-methyltransferase n=1 Tax=Flaviflagellibacter deserti TaxID=2267266 RepID=A0ABV9Z7C5_9HYPH